MWFWFYSLRLYIFLILPFVFFYEHCGFYNECVACWRLSQIVSCVCDEYINSTSAFLTAHFSAFFFVFKHYKISSYYLWFDTIESAVFIYTVDILYFLMVFPQWVENNRLCCCNRGKHPCIVVHNLEKCIPTGSTFTCSKSSLLQSFTEWNWNGFSPIYFCCLLIPIQVVWVVEHIACIGQKAGKHNSS